MSNKDNVINAMVCAVAIGAAIAWLSRPAQELGSTLEEVNARILASEISHTRGTGQLALVEFSDFECEYCSEHARTTGREIDEKLIRSGQIRHVFIHFPGRTHPLAQKASEAAECAAQQGRFWEMHGLLFDRSATLEYNDLMKRAVTLQLDDELFKQCLESSAESDDVRKGVEMGRRLGVNVTPTFFVGTVEADGAIALLRRIIGAVEYQEFEFAVAEVERSARSTGSQ